MKAVELMKRFGRSIEGIVHVGANRGQELPHYRQLDGVPCILVEPIPSVFDQLKQEAARSPHHYPVQALCSNVAGEQVQFHIADNGGEASSMLNASAHLEIFPEIKFTSVLPMTTTTLDALIGDRDDGPFNLLVLDTQGAELKVLEGGRSALENVEGIFTEVSEVSLYQGGATLETVDAYLRAHGFAPKWLDINEFRYGDAFYLRDRIARAVPEAPGVNVALGKPASASSTWSETPFASPEKGNNGTLTGTFGFHTAEEPNPWWQVDLEREQELHEVRVFNRLDMCSERARWLQVLISSDGEAWRMIHDQKGRQFGGIDGFPLQVAIGGERARYVRVTIPRRQSLHLDGIEVY